MNLKRLRVTSGVLGLCLFLVSATQVTSFASPVSLVDGNNNASVVKSEGSRDLASALEEGLLYDEYIAQHKDTGFSEDVHHIQAAQYAWSDYRPEIKDGYQGKAGPSLLLVEEGSVEWLVDVHEDGLYQMQIEYCPIEGRSFSAVSCSIYIDEELPFSQARSLSFPRSWTDTAEVDAETGFLLLEQDRNGNEIRPEAVETPVWQSAFAQDPAGYTDGPFCFYFSEGEHRLRLTAIQGDMAISRITLSAPSETLDYAAVKESYEKADYQAAIGEPVKVQAEASGQKSESVLLPTNEQTSSATEPSDPALLRYNTIGGESWQKNGQWITWQFTVPTSGLYKIALKAKQNITSGANSHRRIYIDGKVPFKELNDVEFSYDTQWQNVTLGGDEQPYLFYFESGKTHEIKMEVTLGDMSSILNEVNQISEELSSIYRRILIVTGPTPDVNRDYEFHKIMPDVIQALQTQSERLRRVFDNIVEVAGNGENAQFLNKIYLQTKEMAEEPETIAERFSAFESNINSLGTWLTGTANQPLMLDYLLIAPPDAQLPKPNAGFFADLWFGIKSFIATFFHDYSLSLDADLPEVKVWVGSTVTGVTSTSAGREQAQILQTLADFAFPGVGEFVINVQVVPMESLLPATMAGTGPDVALMVWQSDVINYAIRNAVIDLRQYEDFDDLSDRFVSGALESVSFDGKTYGLPVTQTFPVLFYRKDILSELGLSVPQTWQEVIQILPVLQKRQLNFGMAPTVGSLTPSTTSFTMLLYQNGGQLYTEDGKKSMLDTKVAIDAFSFLGSLYTDYKLPVTIDFINRFRSGSVPLGIADYSLYNQLSVFAPELEGLWDFAIVPGTPGTDGVIDHSVPSGVTASVILSQGENHEQSWEFIKWWTQDDIQATFGRELESVLGTAARFPTANKEAMTRLPWQKQTYEKLMAQRAWVKPFPEVPGGYYTSRYVDFAFRDVINNASATANTNSSIFIDSGELLIKAAETINKEIDEKRQELGLN